MSSRKWARAAKAVFVATMAIAVAWASPASAQVPHSTTLTPAGTAIKNVASVAYKDSTNNDYTAKDSVIVTVGKYADIDVRRWADSVTNASPSTDTITFTIQNYSNDSTQINFALIDSTENVTTGVTYLYNGTPYATLADLKTGVNYVHQGDSIVVKVVYDVQAGKGGLYDWLGLTASTVITTDGGSAATDSDQTKINVSLTGNVAVTPDNFGISKTPGTYEAQFYVRNGETGSDNFNLVDSATVGNSAGIQVISMYVCGTPNTPVTTTGVLAAGDSIAICVSYSVANNGPGTSGSVYLTATSTTKPGTVYDSGNYNITIVGPSITITKTAFLDDNGTMSSTPITSGMTVLPHQYIWYKMTVANGAGAREAQSIEITDALPTQVLYISKTDSGSWTYTGADLDGVGTDTLKAQLATLAAGASAYVAIRVQIK